MRSVDRIRTKNLPKLQLRSEARRDTRGTYSIVIQHIVEQHYMPCIAGANARLPHFCSFCGENLITFTKERDGNTTNRRYLFRPCYVAISFLHSFCVYAAASTSCTHTNYDDVAFVRSMPERFQTDACVYHWCGVCLVAVLLLRRTCNERECPWQRMHCRSRVL